MQLVNVEPHAARALHCSSSQLDDSARWRPWQHIQSPNNEPNLALIFCLSINNNIISIY